MTWFIVKLASVIFGLWFLNGLRKVWRNPRFKIVSYDKYDSGLSKYGDPVVAIRLNVKRQEFIPPFRVLDEVWMKFDDSSSWKRVPDGKVYQESIGLYDLYLIYIAEQTYLDKTINDNP